jgi:DNA-binding transcriptional ArsR family regulator
MRLEQVVSDLVDRVSRLEALAPRSLDAVLESDDEPPPAGQVVYSGTGPWQGRAVVWQMTRTWDDVVHTDPEPAARVLAALASPVRLRIIGSLVAGPATTSELAERVVGGTSGQLFHHLKELLAVGVVHQPRRGVYALRPQHAVPLLAVLSATLDVAPAESSATP